MSRPYIKDTYDKALEIINKPYHLPKTSNKGLIGIYLEQLLGIPQSTQCLDCADGEVKTFPVKKIEKGKNKGNLVPKEPIAITMIRNDTLKAENFIESKCFKKMTNILYVPHFRNGDNITFMSPTIINLNDEANQLLKQQINDDYDTIRNCIIVNNTLDGSSGVGKYLFPKTKGAGNGAPRTRAFYLRKEFMNEFTPMNLN